METVAVISEQLNLPEEIVRKLKGKEVQFFETKEGILLRPLKDSIKEARGFFERKPFFI